MRSFVAVVAVVGFLVAINAVFGGVVLALGKACQSILSDCLGQPAAIVVGLLALIACLAFARFVISAVSKKRR